MRFGRRRCLAWALLTLAWALPAPAQDVAGVVVDPQDRRIVGAAVVLECDATILRTESDGDGRFHFRVQAGTGPCTLRVTAPHFAARSIPATSAGAPTTVRLDVDQVVETVEVRAAATTAPAAVMLTREEMRTISDDPVEIVRVAEARAGPATGHAIYVDGLPAGRLPPVSRMATLAVASDPYSSEYADPGLRRIEISTLAPDRRWAIEFGGSPGAIDAASPLGDRSRSRSLRGGMSGPSPWPGGAFAVHGSVDALTGNRAVVAAPSDVHSGVLLAPYGLTTRSVSFQFHQSLTALDSLRIEASRLVDRAANAGVGGEVLPEAGSSRDGSATELRLLVNHDARAASWRSQLLANWSADATAATSSAPAVQVQGAFVGGGAAIASAATGQGRLFWKNVIASPTARLPWRLGLSLQRSVERRRQAPNEAGSIQVSSSSEWRAALEGAAVATAFRGSAPAMQRVALLDAAGFGEIALVQTAKLRLTAGARADWQSRDGIRYSPRLSATGQHGAWTLGGGVGLFTQTWQPAFFLGTRVAEGTVPAVIMRRQVSLGDARRAEFEGEPIVMDVAPGLTRARYVMASQSAERPIGRLSIGVEHLWWRGAHLLGAERLRDSVSSGWTDWLESNRALESHQVRVRMAFGGPRHNASLTYARTLSNDNTDGPWSFAARQGDLGAEWARSARVAAHSVDGAVSTSLPGAVHLTATATFRGVSPYDIVSGHDAEENGLFTDRGGLPRNSGRLPASRSVALYLHRRFNLAALFGPRADVPLDGGVQVDNALGTRAWTLVGNVVGSPLFGRPEGALPGRSLRVWFALAR